MIETEPRQPSAPTPPAAPPSLATYLDTLRGRPTELRTVSREVNPLEFEVTAVLEQLDRRGEFPAVLFERTRNVHGDPSPFPILTNIWGTRERCAEMLGLPPERSKRDLGLRFAELMGQREFV